MRHTLLKFLSAIREAVTVICTNATKYYMDVTKQLKVLYALIGLLLLGQIYVVYVVQHSGVVAMEKPIVADQLPSDQRASTTLSNLADIRVGGSQALDTILGTVVQVGNGTLQIKERGTNAVDTISVTTNTDLELGGPMKDNATQQKELAAYNEQIKILIKDPEANKAALAAMKLPSPQILTPIVLSALQAGDAVVVAANNSDPKGVYPAVSVIKLTSASTLAPLMQ